MKGITKILILLSLVSLVACGGSGDTSSGMGEVQILGKNKRPAQSDITYEIALDLLQQTRPDYYAQIVRWPAYIMDDLATPGLGSVNGAAYRGEIILDSEYIDNGDVYRMIGILAHEARHLNQGHTSQSGESDAVAHMALVKLPILQNCVADNMRWKSVSLIAFHCAINLKLTCMYRHVLPSLSTELSPKCRTTRRRYPS